MKQLHPNLSLAAALAVCMSPLAAGCKNPQGVAAANPFLAPNRVPPPATRALLPGQAQPYYPGDPLPVMQSNAAQPANDVKLASVEAEMPSADGNLAWGSPRSVAASPNEFANAPPQSVTQPSATLNNQQVASNEPNVAIPDDGNALRFALPAQSPQSQEPQPFTPSGPTAAMAAAPRPIQQQQVAPLPAPPTSFDASQAAYTTPVITNNEPVTNPWRSPQISPALGPPPSLAQSFIPQPASQPLALNAPPLLPAMMPPIVATNPMDVRLRAVASPPDAGVPSMPRIRIPGYDAQPPMVSSYDGFRPRTSMR